MKNEIQKIVLKPNWLLRLFGASEVSIEDSTNKLVLIGKGGEISVIESSSLAEGNGIKEGILFSSITLRTNNGVKTLKGLNNALAKKAYAWLRQYFYQELTAVVEQHALYIKNILGRGYLRTSKWEIIENQAKGIVNFFHLPPEAGLVNDVDRSNFLYLYEIANINNAELNKIREKYIENQIQIYSEYFNIIESNPLTQMQRRACVIDEDNNLVLAGAGTGKTSTMIGRVGYLIKSNQAKPEEILMLAFANKAAKEMQERLDEKIKVQGVTASTFHSLGKKIITAVDGFPPSISYLAEDEKNLAKQVDLWFLELLENAEYKKKVIKYFDDYLYPEKNPFDFNSEGEYLDYLLTNEIRTLKGERVKSFEECLIANYFFKNGIDYQYEKSYEIDTRTPDFKQYKPDLYLTKYKVYIEHFGIDKNGNTAPYINKDKYWEGINWKRQLHKENKTKLIETFHYERVDGVLFKNLEKKLVDLGVEFEPLPDESVLETLREIGSITNFSKLLSDLLNLYKANWFEPDQLNRKISNADNPEQVEAALNLMIPILDKYEKLLKENNDIDFNDMIGKAINYVKEGKFKPKWRYILVDEFQDISDSRARLVKSIKNSVKDCSIFCVGDDWQAIYRFAGSDISFTTKFREKFGATRITNLDKTFRFNNSIGEIASKFITKNPSQIDKAISSHVTVNSPAVSLLRQRSESNKDLCSLKTALNAIGNIVKQGASVYILSRFHFLLPDKQKLRIIQNEYKQLNLTAMTFHASKGKESDYVIVLGLESGPFGFPSEKITNPLLEALLPDHENFEFAEERRLFYVAITRAKKKVILLTDMTKASRFVTELIDDKYPIELNEFEINPDQESFRELKCVSCKTGTMIRRSGPFGNFYGCSHYPLCDHKEEVCPVCSGALKRNGRYKVCIKKECDGWIPMCQKCGGIMVKREGRFGQFWGCINYHGSETISCQNTENNIKAPV